MAIILANVLKQPEINGVYEKWKLVRQWYTGSRCENISFFSGTVFILTDKMFTRPQMGKSSVDCVLWTTPSLNTLRITDTIDCILIEPCFSRNMVQSWLLLVVILIRFYLHIITFVDNNGFICQSMNHSDNIMSKQ